MPPWPGAASHSASFLRHADVFDANLPIAKRYRKTVLRNLFGIGRKLFWHRPRRQPLEDRSDLGCVVVSMFPDNPLATDFDSNFAVNLDPDDRLLSLPC